MAKRPEHPGLLEPNEYDVAGAAVGVVEKDKILSSEKVQVGDVVLGLQSSGLHSNGYSLVRKIVADNNWQYTDLIAEFGRTLGRRTFGANRPLYRSSKQAASRCSLPK